MIDRISRAWVDDNARLADSTLFQAALAHSELRDLSAPSPQALGINLTSPQAGGDGSRRNARTQKVVCHRLL